MRSPEALGYPDALAIRNLRLSPNKKSGLLDVLLIPPAGDHKLVLVEAKVSKAKDTDGRCLGQLLKYFTFALEIGSEGRNRLLRFAREHPDRASAIGRTTPKQILGIPNESAGFLMLREGEPLLPEQIGLFIAVDDQQEEGNLPRITATLREHFGLHIGIAVLGNGEVRLA